MIKLNQIPINVKQFPNNESIFDKTNIHNAINNKYKNANHNINFQYEDDRDILHLMFLKRHLDDMRLNDIELLIQYMPYSRMDRDNSSYVFTLKYAAEIINNMKFREVVVFDPHSDVTPALLDRCLVVHRVQTRLRECLEHIRFDKAKDFINRVHQKYEISTDWPSMALIYVYSDLCKTQTDLNQPVSDLLFGYKCGNIDYISELFGERDGDEDDDEIQAWLYCMSPRVLLYSDELVVFVDWT